MLPVFSTSKEIQQKWIYNREILIQALLWPLFSWLILIKYNGIDEYANNNEVRLNIWVVELSQPYYRKIDQRTFFFQKQYALFKT